MPGSTPFQGRVPSLSIGMPAWQAGAHIEAAVRALLDQTFEDFELIISDNASTDGAWTLCQRLAREDRRIRLFRNHTNIGANRNYMAVLRHARAPLFKWASANDICAPVFLERCVDRLRQDASAVLAFSRSALFVADIAAAQPYDVDMDLSASRASERFDRLLLTMGLNNVINGVVRTEALRRALPMGSFQKADIALMAELALLGRFALVPERLFFRRMSPDSATHLKDAREVDRHIEPNTRRPLRLQAWRYHLTLLHIAARQRPISADTLRTLRIALRQTRWARAQLGRELWELVRPEGWDRNRRYGTEGAKSR